MTKQLIQTILCVSLCAGIAAGGAARDLYIDPKGDDGGDGSQGKPWQSLAKVSAEAAAGDTVHFAPGVYEGQLNPANSGEAGKPIVFRSAKRHEAVLAAPSGGGTMVSMAGRAWITLEGLRVTGCERSAWYRVEDSHHIAFEDCRFEMSGKGGGSRFRNSEHIRLVGNVFSRDYFWGNMTDLQICSYLLIEGNSFTHAGHCPLQMTQCRNAVIRANCFRNDWGRNYEFWSSGKLLVESNVVTEARDSAGSADSRAKNLYHDSIFRFNRVFRNRHTPLNSGSYFPMGAKPTSHHREPFRLVNSRIYNNTIVDNLGQGWQFYGMDVSANVVFNNIFYMNDKTANGTQVWISDDISRDNQFLNNLMRGTEPGQKVVRYGSDYFTVEQMNGRMKELGGFWTEFGGNIDADPKFRAIENHDYRLAEGSAAIDAGVPVTIAIGNGEGTALPVSDAYGFFDGFGVEGEKGDWIAVARPDQIARIVRIEHRYYQPGVLHLDRKVAWTDGAPVSLPWSGKAPDMGAYERGVAHPARVDAFASPADTSPGKPVQFSLDSYGAKIESVEWDFGDDVTSTELAPTHKYAQVGNHGVTVRAKLAGGERVAGVVFVKVAIPPEDNPPLAWSDFEEATKWQWGFNFKFYRNDLTDWKLVDGVGHNGSRCVHLFGEQTRKSNTSTCKIAPGEWEIDKYPTIRFAYRIPKGVPVAIVLEPFVTEGLPRGVVVGGTEKHAVGRYEETDKYRLVDDGEWHTITLDARTVREKIPNLKYLRRFLLFLNWGRKPDPKMEFWFDDFAIDPAKQ